MLHGYLRKVFFFFLFSFHLSAMAAYPEKDCSYPQKDSIDWALIKVKTANSELYSKAPQKKDQNKSFQESSRAIEIESLVEAIGRNRQTAIDWTSENFSSIFEFIYRNIELPLRQSYPKYRDKAFQVFEEKVHPYLQEKYKAYYENYGAKLAVKLYELYLNMLPVFEKLENFYKSFSITDTTKQRVSIMKAFESLSITFMKVRAHYHELFHLKSDEMDMLILNSLSNTHRVELIPLRQILEKLRPAVKNKELAQCLNIHLVESEEINAFNTGCNTFVTLGMFKLLSKEELLAVVSHEIGHAIELHSVRRFLDTYKGSVKHFSFLLFDEVAWLFTAEINPQLNKTMQEGNISALLSLIADYTAPQELEADAQGALLLNRAGVDIKHAVDALMKTHAISTIEQLKEDKLKVGNHPSPADRYEVLRGYNCH